METGMKKNLKLLMVLIGFTLNVDASISCKILMNTFEESGKKTVYDLDFGESSKYKACLDDMKLIPKSYKSFEERTETEALKRKNEYRKKEQITSINADFKQITKTRDIYTFTGKELEQMFNKPVFAYRFVTRDRFTDSISKKHYAIQRLTDINELCKAIGKENDIKGMRAVDAHMELDEAQRERDYLNKKGIIIPDTFWSWKSEYKNFETSKKIRNKMRSKGANKFKVLVFSEVSCVLNDNEKDTFEDLNPSVTLHTKTKKFTSIIVQEKDDEVFIIAEDLEIAEKERKE